MNKILEDFVAEIPFKMLQHREEIIAFLEWMEIERIDKALEIGTGPGGTTYLLGTVAQDFIISIDLPSEATEDRHRELGSALDNFFGVMGNSQHPEVERQIADRLNGELVDLLFIDGDHRYPYVRQDYEVYGKFVRPGGWIAFHDINASPSWGDMGVPQFWGELKGEKREFTIRADWGGIGVIRK